MNPNFKLVLLLGAMSATFSKYVYVIEKKYCSDAQSHCRNIYTDLAPINNEADTKLLQELASNVSLYIWFGLMKKMTDADKWMWSGGGQVKWFNWDETQPNGNTNENYGLLLNYKWHDGSDEIDTFFFCYSVHVVREEKTWEGALDHCREHYKDLASISSETEMMLIQTELQKNVTTQHVWMGLHFLSGDWLWVDGQTAEYEAWGQGGTPQCPEEQLSCGALVNSSGVNTMWKALNCEERLHFICY